MGNSELNYRLHFSCITGHVEDVRKAIQAGADINSLGLNGQLTPLLTAVNSGYTDIVKILLEKGADTEISCEGYTPLILASSAGYLEIVHLLIEQGANIEARDSEGNTAFLQAALEGKADTVKFLLLTGAERYATNYKNENAVQLALKNDHNSVATFLKNEIQI